jgi:hypothetical protein
MSTSRRGFLGSLFAAVAYAVAEPRQFIRGLAFDLNRVFGDGSDGDAVITSNFSLTRNVNFRNLTVRNGTLRTNGYRVCVTGTLAIEGGKLDCGRCL